VTRTLPERIAAIATGLAAAIVVVAIAILPFLTPAWVGFEQGRTNATGLTGYSEADLRTATNAILHDLVIGPPDFAVQVAGAPVLEERERSHMRDVRGVFAGFALLALVAGVVLVAGILGARRMGHVERAWGAIGTGMRVLVVGIVAAGVIASVAFDAAFEVFHRLFFPGGSYTFDPRTDRLVQLFPFDFGSETTIVLGVVIVVLAVAIALAAGRLARRATTARAGAPLEPAAGHAATIGSEPAEAGR
jgi:integral membrane protein (TIGR01906 family)